MLGADEVYKVYCDLAVGAALADALVGHGLVVHVAALRLEQSGSPAGLHVKQVVHNLGLRDLALVLLLRALLVFRHHQFKWPLDQTQVLQTLELSLLRVLGLRLFYSHVVFGNARVFERGLEAGQMWDVFLSVGFHNMKFNLTNHKCRL